MKIPMILVCAAVVLGAAFRGLSAAPSSDDVTVEQLNGMATLMSGDELGSLPAENGGVLVTNEGPGSIVVDLVDTDGSTLVSFGLPAGRWRFVPLEEGQSIRIKDVPDPQNLGSTTVLS